MSPHLEKELIQAYPQLFGDVTKSLRETCMCWGVEFGDGWYRIFKDLCEYLSIISQEKIYVPYANISSEKDDGGEENEGGENKGEVDIRGVELPVPRVVFSQCKEKYGTMRVYIHFASDPLEKSLEESLDRQRYEQSLNKYYDRVYSAIDYVEFLSSRTCEQTGREGKLYTEGWYRTLCPQKAMEYGYEETEDSQER